MDSINKNQPEENHQNLSTEAAITKIEELVKIAKTCFFCTQASSNYSGGVRPMSIQKVDKTGILWFLSANDSFKNREIKNDSKVKLYFQGSAHSDFLFLEGVATIAEDPTIIKQLWEPLLKVWFTEGENDPRISAIKVEPLSGYYWDNKHGDTVAGIKMLIGASIGKTLDDSVEG
ncbi:MAG: pyridoxamine 5'-phosphate oxidase family protein, partial [Pyrinomonadaceae bacterium]|nr:pyridoxamine 5'-phosphate oxidase family protein [Sphingobacteriaceae bacterium]